MQELCGILAKLFSIVCFSGEICFFYKIIYSKNFIAYFQGLYTFLDMKFRHFTRTVKDHIFKFQGPNKLTFNTGSKLIMKIFYHAQKWSSGTVTILDFSLLHYRLSILDSNFILNASFILLASKWHLLKFLGHLNMSLN